MTLLAAVVAQLRTASIPHAIIGAAAMSAHGISRATADVDLLTTDQQSLTLYAGGPQDAWDIQQVLALPEAASLVTLVETRLAPLPEDAIGL